MLFFLFMVITLLKYETKVEANVILLHCHQANNSISCEIHGVHVKKPNQYEFKLACPFQYSYDRVKKITFERSQVEFLPKSFFNTLRNVQKANICKVKLKNIHPEAFFYAKYLETLNLSDNLLSLLGSKEFIGAENLKTLDLTNNQLYFIDEEAFSGISNLEILILQRNQLKSLSSLILTPLVKLKVFDLSENYLTRTEQEFCNNRSLIEIKLNRNGLKDLKCSNLYLESLTLSGNQLDYLPTNSFLIIKGLLKLDISYNLLKEVNFAKLNKQIVIKYLNLSHNGIMNLNRNAFSKVIYVQVLDISYNQLQSINVASLDALKNLEELHIDGNLLVQFDFFTVKNIHTKLRMISIADNKWDCQFFDNVLQIFCNTNVVIKHNVDAACGDVIIPIQRSPIDPHSQGKITEQVFYISLLLFGLFILLYIVFALFNKYCLNRILLA